MEVQRDRFYSLEEVMELLRLSRNVVAGMLSKGELKGAKMGRQWRILGTDILDYYERQKRARGGETGA